MAPFSREYAEPLVHFLPPLTLDRQRVVHSSAFRRLQYKTQVFVAAEDHFRTRLTHTLEVTHLARILAAALGRDVELAEVVALAHDVGHPPFGHAGERALNELLRPQGGFEHNSHALRVVEYLEHPYPQFRGLNLTLVVRQCLARHSTQFDRPGPHPLRDGRPPPPEGHVAALADRLAYTLHDLQDGLYAALVEPTALRGISLWEEAYSGPADPAPQELRHYLRPTIDRIQRLVVEDVADWVHRNETCSPQAPLSAGPRGAATGEGGMASDPVGWVPAQVSPSPPMLARLEALERLLIEQVYRHPRLMRMDARAQRIVTAVFEAYVGDPRRMPKRFEERVAEQGVERVAADYIAGMTDRYCLREYRRLCDPRIGHG